MPCAQIPPSCTLALVSLLAVTTITAAQERAPPAAPPAETVEIAVAPPEKPPTIAERSKEMRRQDGLLALHLDDQAGAVWLELPAPDANGRLGAYLYVESLRSGLGSNPIGLDRGQTGETRLVDLRVVGKHLLVEQRNLGYRALSDNAAERDAVRESFASSILWAGEIGVRDPDGRLLVDVSTFVTRDAHSIASRLRRSDQGTFSLDADRSMVDPGACLAFPDNIELEGLLTFKSDQPGPLVRGVAAEAQALTFSIRHTFVRLPDDGYHPRPFDPRMGSNAVRFVDYAAALDAPRRVAWIGRHRLEKIDPSSPRSRVREPIVYYVDRGAPEPVRSALIEGASWWAEAFEAAGFIDAFRVEVMPEGVHPLDVRYNVIQWVHRSTRGWSYGGAIRDPRTGEIIKGHVSLGSLRVRQDRLLFEGLAGTERTGTGAPDDPIEIALARIRQLSAHEVGHTLGFAHNFAASSWGRASVMDYPAPRVRVRDGRLDFSEAYAVGIGTWDIHAVRYAYTQFAPGVDESAALAGIVEDGLRRGYVFLTDQDARSPGSAHPAASLWDDGANAVTALEETMAARRFALARFGERNIRAGRPLAYLHEVFVPVYLHHRYQVEAAVKLIGGVTYAHALRGDGQPGTAAVDATEQRRALVTVLGTIDPVELDVPSSVVRLLVPRPTGESTSPEMIAGATAPTFDPLAAAGIAADMTIVPLLHPARCARLVEQRRADPGQLGLEEMLGQLLAVTFAGVGDPGPRRVEIARAVQRILVQRLIMLAQDERAAAAVRARVNGALDELRTQLAVGRIDWHRRDLESVIVRHLDRPFDTPPPTRAADPSPPGGPIGSAPPPLNGCGHDLQR